MPNHRFPYLVWNVPSDWVVDIKKWFKRWDVEDLLELSSDVMKYVVIEERLMEPLTKKWKDAKRT